MLDDTENSIKWLTMTVKVPYKKIGMNGRPRAGKTKKDADRTYTIANGDKAELWYVYGKGSMRKTCIWQGREGGGIAEFIFHELYTKQCPFIKADWRGWCASNGKYQGSICGRI